MNVVVFAWALIDFLPRSGPSRGDVPNPEETLIKAAAVLVMLQPQVSLHDVTRYTIFLPDTVLKTFSRRRLAMSARM